MGMSVHRSAYPNRAPAIEYVAIPPASLSTEAVMIPGPRTDRNSRIFFLLNPRKLTSSSFRGVGSPKENTTPLPSFVPQKAISRELSCKIGEKRKANEKFP
jgi:hypothetical protein